MSKELEWVEGFMEGNEPLSNREPTVMHLVSFYGGEKKGRMLQLTPEDDYIQLDREGVSRLIEVLQDWEEDNG